MALTRDKIFDNNYGKNEIDGSKTSFSPDKNFKEKPIDEKLDELIVENIIDSAIEEHPSIKNLISEYEITKKINKKQINELFRFCISMPKVCNIEAFSYLVVKIEIKEEKLYESLSNQYKKNLIDELKTRGYLKDDKAPLF